METNIKSTKRSRLNKILHSFEKSILSQFGSIGNLAASGTDADQTKSNKSGSSSPNTNQQHRQQRQNSSAQSATDQVISDKTNNEKKQAYKKFTSVLQNELSLRTDTVTRQAKITDSNCISNNGSKLTLDAGFVQAPARHQPNHNITTLNTANYISNPILSQHTGFNNNVSPSSNINTLNRLSIPPPHASEEARNQTQQLLFGAISNTENDVKNLYGPQASPQHQLVRIMNHDGNNIMFLMPTTDISHNIYANAPPKPLRYQYYNINQVVPSVQSYYSHLPVPQQPGLKRIGPPSVGYNLSRSVPIAPNTNPYQSNHQQQQKQQQHRQQMNNAHFGYNYLAHQAKPFFGSQYNLSNPSVCHVGFPQRSVDLINMGSNQRLNSGYPNQNLMRDSRNSQLIVDLTTPRVLAKTQTTISSASTSQSSSSNSSTSFVQLKKTSPPWSSSINQVGLPEMTSSSNFNRTMSMSMLENMSLQPTSSTSRPNSFKVDKTNGLTYIEQANNNYSNAAPYYYSDLKSEEQREAFQSIVQHKSLSPPPKLLSRSIDQSITRLTLKSATLHPTRPQVPYDSLANTLRPAKSFTVVSDGSHGPKLNSFSSSTDITGNTDRMFGIDYPKRMKNVTNGFNNVLGNVIDVDNICPVNNLSQCLPVNNNRITCLN